MQRCGVQLRYRGAVSALHIVGVNFQFRFGIDFRFVTGQQVFIAQLCRGLLRTRMNMNATIEYRFGAVGDDAAESFAGSAMGNPVFNAGVVIHMLIKSRQINTVELAMGTFTIVIDHHIYAF